MNQFQIFKQKKIREKTLIRNQGTKSLDAIRRHNENIPDNKNYRPAYFHDTDRIIHSKAYSRYIDKTQVFFRVKNDHVTRRVLHVQLVSKIARTLGRFFYANEDLIEAIALAHDIGHAPFGHAGEDNIAEKLEQNNAGNFLHNAQSVRVLELLEKKGKSMNLTLQVLDGVLGHNGELASQTISFAPEKLTFKNLDENVKKCLTEPRKNKPDKYIFPSTLEGAIVRISDIIAYVGRDLDDAIAMKMVKRKEMPQKAIKYLGKDTKEIINALVMDLTVNTSLDKNQISFSTDCFNALAELKQFNYDKIYNAKVIKEQKHRYKKIMNELFDEYVKDIEDINNNSDIVKFFLKGMDEKYIDETGIYRKVADYMSGMTDRFLLERYAEHFMPYDLEPFNED